MPVGGTAWFGQNQHPRLTTNYLNQLNRVGDPGAGVNVSTAQMSGSIVQEYLGFAGSKLTITNPWASLYADSRVGPLYGGIYQYVKLSPSVAALARGQQVFWLDELNYIVTGAGASGANKQAGVALNNTAPGNWDFIQVAGIAMVMFAGAGTIGQSTVFDPTVTPANVTAVTPTPTNVPLHIFGTVVLTAATGSQISPVELNIPQGYNF